MTPRTPRDAASALEAAASLPDEPDRERLRGYAVTGLTFSSGHVLAMRRFPATSLQRPYTSVWHRSPDGRWTIYQDQPPQYSCPRAFGPAIAAAPVVPISIDWAEPAAFDMTIDVPENATALADPAAEHATHPCDQRRRRRGASEAAA